MAKAVVTGGGRYQMVGESLRIKEVIVGDGACQKRRRESEHRSQWISQRMTMVDSAGC